MAGKEGEDYVTEEYLEALQAEMLEAAQNLEFERAALLRDKIAQAQGRGGGDPAGEGPTGPSSLKPETGTAS